MTLHQASGEGFFLIHSITKEPKESHFSIHMHNDYEIFCFVSGNARYMVEGRVWRLEYGSLLLMRPGETHKLLLDGPEPYERYVINFTPEVLPAELRSSLLAPFHDRPLGEENFYSPSHFGSLTPLALFEAMCNADGDSVRIRSYLSALLSSVLLDEAEKQIVPDPQSLGAEMVDFVNLHLCDPVTLPMLVEHFHLSVSQINRIFRSVTGTTVGRYCHAKRLLRARQLIATGMGAQEAAQSCGFSCYSSFFRLFKKRFGFSPSNEK